MNIESQSKLEAAIIRLLQDGAKRHDFREILTTFRSLADDASIKAALLALSAKGVIEITRDWEFHSVCGEVHH